MAITLVASVSATPGANGGATAAIDTTAATLLVVSVAWYSPGSAPTVTDSKGNTWIGLTSRLQGTVRHRLFYCLTPIVGASHTFTAAATTCYPAIFAYAFAGVASYQTESGATATSGTSLASGSVTPSANGALLLTGAGGDSVSTASVSTSGFTVTTTPKVGGNNMHGSAAWAVQTTAAAINPTWAFSPSLTAPVVGTAVFLASAAAAAERVATYLWGPL